MFAGRDGKRSLDAMHVPPQLCRSAFPAHAWDLTRSAKNVPNGCFWQMVRHGPNRAENRQLSCRC